MKEKNLTFCKLTSAKVYVRGSWLWVLQKLQQRKTRTLSQKMMMSVSARTQRVKMNRRAYGKPEKPDPEPEPESGTGTGTGTGEINEWFKSGARSHHLPYKPYETTFARIFLFLETVGL